jgi:HK97 family phage prohead protease
LGAKVIELRRRKGTTVEITGSPIVYNSPYVVRDLFGEFEETMMPGVCSAALVNAETDCRFLFDHSSMPMARTRSKTLTLKDTPTALRFTALVDTRQRIANDLVIALERGDVSQMSCGFIVARDSWNDDMTKRSIHSFRELLDVSAVTYPASPTTSISLAGAGMGGRV